jgi:predicted deacylase
MPRLDTIALPPASLGTERRLRVHRFGDAGARPKAYVQAALHADETPAMLVAHHLLGRLREIEAEGGILGEVVVVPVANPLGLSQRMLNLHVGRSDLGGGGNYNRRFPDLGAAVLAGLDGRLGSNVRENDRFVRAALREAAADLRPITEVEALRAVLLRLAVDADIVLDLHCHFEGVTYLYCNEAGWPGARDLSADIGSRATLIGDGGGGSFDEACDAPWRRVRDAHPDRVEHGCLSVTIEYRGQADVSDELAAEDAQNLVRFLQRRGVLAGDPGPLPDARCEGTPVDAVDHVRAPAPGVIVHKVGLGERVREGQVVAEIVDPDDLDAPRTLLRARADGLVFGRLFSRVARPGTAFLSIAGTEPDKVRDGLGDPYP